MLVFLHASRMRAEAKQRPICSEMSLNFRRKFEGLATVSEFTGDTETNDTSDVPLDSSIVCCTPEKYDSCSRCWAEAFHGQTKLVLIDEVHLLSEERGPSHESCVARIRMRLPGAR